jgi:hypothetical protein
MGAVCYQFIEIKIIRNEKFLVSKEKKNKINFIFSVGGKKIFLIFSIFGSGEACYVRDDEIGCFGRVRR